MLLNRPLFVYGYHSRIALSSSFRHVAKPDTRTGIPCALRRLSDPSSREVASL